MPVGVLGGGGPVLLMMTNALGKEILDLTVDGAKILVRPRGQSIIKRMREAQGELLFGRLSHGYTFFEPLEGLCTA